MAKPWPASVEKHCVVSKGLPVQSWWGRVCAGVRVRACACVCVMCVNMMMVMVERRTDAYVFIVIYCLLYSDK